ncbi:hypothetical protein ZZ1p0087 [Acinetobacter phage ZZ1]|jgi:hypothetical protein|uniref:Uncharacterized protein n=2 Tax=Caudoviricetes TaxID=2731619 RepID=I3WVK0_9CAUD|nr:hypothetical protein ZZ1p0087 [Acinetobacter phage ZZ1]AFL47520.1 hypothetical protein ZZ1p0087 [Acinetobacter phage ZZ1]
MIDLHAHIQALTIADTENLQKIAAALVESNEKILQDKITADISRNQWVSIEAPSIELPPDLLRRAFTYIRDNYVKTGKTQMQIEFVNTDQQFARSREPSIKFYIERKDRLI